MNLDNVIATRMSKTIYRDGDRCVKLFEPNFSKSDILNEALNQSRVEETGLNIPKVIEVTTIDGKWAIVSEFIAGKTMATLMEENPDKKDEYVELLVALQMDMHTRTNPLLNKLKDKMNRKIHQADLDDTTRCNLLTRLESMPKLTKLCHGDFRPSNIIIRESDGVPFIIDWSHATQGNSFADAARTYLLFCLNGDKENAEKYLELFCQKSRIGKQYVQEWIPIMAASQSVKGKAEERKFLLSWANVVN